MATPPACASETRLHNTVLIVSLGCIVQVASVRVGSSNQNELLEYIQSLGGDADLLTTNASQDVLDAMTSFIDRCMGALCS